MYDDELHEKASDYASNRRDGYLAQMQLGKVKKKTQDELNWVWVAHYEGYKEALAHPEQEPVAWMDKDGDVLSASIIDGNGLRNIPLYTTPPQRTEQEREACERCKQLEEQAYDLVGELRVANIKLSMRPQRTWVGLTDDEIWEAYMKAPLTLDCSTDELYALARTVEIKLKDKNNG